MEIIIASAQNTGREGRRRTPANIPHIDPTSPILPRSKPRSSGAQAAPRRVRRGARLVRRKAIWLRAFYFAQQSSLPPPARPQYSIFGRAPRRLLRRRRDARSFQPQRPRRREEQVEDAEAPAVAEPTGEHVQGEARRRQAVGRAARHRAPRHRGRRPRVDDIQRDGDGPDTQGRERDVRAAADVLGAEHRDVHDGARAFEGRGGGARGGPEATSFGVRIRSSSPPTRRTERSDALPPRSPRRLAPFSPSRNCGICS